MFDDKTIKSGKRLTEIYATTIAVILLSVSFFYSGVSHILHHKIFCKNLIDAGFSEGLFTFIITYFLAVYEIFFSVLILIPPVRKLSSSALIVLSGFYTVFTTILLIKAVNINSYFYGFLEPISFKLILKGVVYFLFAAYLLSKSYKNV